MSALVFVALTAQGATLARKLAPRFPGAEVHGLIGRVSGADVSFAQTATHLRQLFRAERPIVGLCSAAILIRILASALGDKGDDPPVLALAEDGSVVVPLLGGHRGANKLATEIAAALGIRAALTTAGDNRFGFALDDPPNGWSLGPGDVKSFAAGALGGARPKLVSDVPQNVDLGWLSGLVGEGPTTLRITERAVAANTEALALHPHTLVLGVGCERGADPAELIALARQTLDGYAQGSLACIASLDLKEDEPAVRQLALSLGVPLRLFDAARLERETPRVSDASPIVFQAVGTHSVAEAAALAAAGDDATLVMTKNKSKRCTAALARADRLIDVEHAGRQCGRLAIVGIGPGASDWRTPEATSDIATATDLVGYRLYIDLLGELASGKTRHDYDLGEEGARCAFALDLAVQGKQVALICSGDAGIYAMASLVYEKIEQGGDAWKRLEVRVAPGISALQAAAARLGAPLGHDFCAISLSDLLTPWETIERRVKAASEGDFVIAFYNPASRRRREPFLKALEILRRFRAPETPVGIARDLGRPDEAVRIVPLGELNIDMIDMLTVLIVGSTQTRNVTSGGSARLYTPRGYAAKGSKG
jgi:cobalt-precorrin 5A hydrolase/precorrin-3B C17-methyltransferase